MPIRAFSSIPVPMDHHSIMSLWVHPTLTSWGLGPVMPQCWKLIEVVIGGHPSSAPDDVWQKLPISCTLHQELPHHPILTFSSAALAVAVFWQEWYLCILARPIATLTFISVICGRSHLLPASWLRGGWREALAAHSWHPPLPPSSSFSLLPATAPQLVCPWCLIIRLCLLNHGLRLCLPELCLL